MGWDIILDIDVEPGKATIYFDKESIFVNPRNSEELTELFKQIKGDKNGKEKGKAEKNK
ncbi:MAG: hypothetical protein GY861_01100 [bacterium]|nr:hypothetical protein [bacterium]